MVREWNQAGKTDSEYKENNANARAQSANSQDVSLEDDLLVDANCPNGKPLDWIDVGAVFRFRS